MGMDRCFDLPLEYVFSSQYEALEHLRSKLGIQELTLHSKFKSSPDAPCEDGKHTNVRYGGTRMGSITVCECTDGVQTFQRYRVHR